PVPRPRARSPRHCSSVLSRIGGLGGDGTAEPVPASPRRPLRARVESVGGLRRPLRPGGPQMTRLCAFLGAFVVATLLATAGTATAYHTRFVADSCNTAAPTPTSYITRDGSATVALRARYEGYQWGGGCWNDNDRDDSPGDPHEDPATGGEGGDCS